MTRLKYVVNFDRLGMGEIERVGGKNASLGEMLVQLSKAGVQVPGGFATTAAAFREFLAAGGLAARIEARLKGLDADDVEALARCGAEIRGWIEATPFSKQLEAEIGEAFRELTGGDDTVSLAVRSSATAEDLPDASRRQVPGDPARSRLEIAENGICRAGTDRPFGKDGGGA